MTTHNLEEIAYLKVSEQALQKIEKIKTILRDINCTTHIITPIIFEKNVMEFQLKISFPVI